MNSSERPLFVRSASARVSTPLLQKASRSPPPSSPSSRAAQAFPGSPSARGSELWRGHGSPEDEVQPPSSPSRKSKRISRFAVVAPTTLRREYAFAAVFLVLALVTFTSQTELSGHVQQELGWNKAYCMMYLTHTSWVLLWPLQLLVLRLRSRHVPWTIFWRRHVSLIRSTILTMQTRHSDPGLIRQARLGVGPKPSLSPARYLLRSTVIVSAILTVASSSWYIAVGWTNPADVTAIWNCNAFFAYAFSVPILGERLRLGKALSVVVAIVGVLVVTYGGSPSSPSGAAVVGNATRRVIGNMVVAIGSVLYGLHEVTYKRFGCPPDGTSPGRSVIFAMTFSSCLGLLNLLVLWIPLPILHLTGLEPFGLPSGRAAFLTLLAILSNTVCAGSFMALISLTSPVFGGVASLLTIFLVAVVDWVVKRRPLSTVSMFGCLLVIVAFLVLCWSSYSEMSEACEDQSHMSLSGHRKPFLADGDGDGGDSDSGTDD